MNARFHCRTVQCDGEGYYYPRWDRATPVVVDAATRQEAVNQVVALMGEPKRGWYWGVKVDRVEQIGSPA